MRTDHQGITIAYITGRREPKIEWFFDSLSRQLDKDEVLMIIVVDHYHNSERGYLARKEFIDYPNITIRITNEKPNVWQGKYRLTKEDWFAAANARNTALCLCETTHIAHVDDLSLLMPGWLDAVKVAVAGNYVAAGAYQKVNKLVVENGLVESFSEFAGGHDHRLSRSKQDVEPCRPGWLFGCSCVFPVEALLTVGGWPEYCDSMGGEDYILGMALRNAGFELKFCREMLTVESEELHHAEPTMKRMDKGVSPNDKSHRAHDMAMHTKYFENYYEGGIRRMREKVLNGQPFPIVQIPDRDWFDGQPLSEM